MYSALLLRAHVGCIVALLIAHSPPPSVGSNSGFYADNGLQQTMVINKMPGRQRKEIQQEILTLLGLHHKPKPRTPGKEVASAPRFMLDLYNTLEADERWVDGDDIHFHSTPNSTLIRLPQLNGSDVIMSFVNHAGKIHFLRHEQDRTFFFDFSEVSPEETVTGAELRLYKAKSNRMNKHVSCRIEIFMIKQGMDPEEKSLESECNSTIPVDYEGWLSLNVTKAADSWTTFPISNMGLYLKITDLSGREIHPDRMGIVGRRGSSDKQPFMVGFFKMSKQLHVRRTRSVKQQPDPTTVAYNDDPYWGWGRSRRYARRMCQRRVLFVNFRDLGWQNWIIAPDGYSAFFCDGECMFPLGLHMNATNHAIVQLLVHTVKSHKVPKPCCTPTKLSAISVLYFDDNSNVILKKYKNMKVKACGCH